MVLNFGLAFDDLVFPLQEESSGGVLFCGPNKLLSILEGQLGLGMPSEDNEHLRIEHYRQAIKQYLEQFPIAFFSASFEADHFATVVELLRRRDELLLSGWDFSVEDEMPERLKCLAGIERIFSESAKDYVPGFADRFVMVLNHLAKNKAGIAVLHLNEPLFMLPSFYLHLFKKLERQGVKIKETTSQNQELETDLGIFRECVNKNISGKKVLKKDGSLLIVKSKRDSKLSAFLAKLIKDNPDYQPLCLIPEKSRALDNALIQEGMPTLGVRTASLARPVLQSLKLVTTFLWAPVDPFKIMEFVSLPEKPLDSELARRIAFQLAQAPGVSSPGWYFMLRKFFEELEEKAKRNGNINVGQIRNQYNFWFERKRYDISKTAPKEDAIAIFNFLFRWAIQSYEDSGNKSASLIILAEQAKKIKELLEALPEKQLSPLQLERIVRTVYEPAPVALKAREMDALSVVHHSGAIGGTVDKLLWWNFSQTEQDHFFSRWFKSELDYLESKEVFLQGPAQENALLIRHRMNPVVQTKKQLLLAVPDLVEGKEVHAHPLFGNLEALFPNLDEVIFDIDTEAGSVALKKYFTVAHEDRIPVRYPSKPQAFITLNKPLPVDELGQETFSSLENLLYYPYQWVFRHKLNLKKSSLLSVVKDVTLMGNLSHRIFEKMMEQDFSGWDKAKTYQWVEKQMMKLLEEEGVVFLMYGREPERVSLIKRVKYAAWNLLSLIQTNNWSVVETEKNIEGEFADTGVRGRADLVLQRGEELAVIDLKWGGARYRENTIKSMEDLQLVFYSHLLGSNGQLAHTAYFIIKDARMIARNEKAFKDITAVSEDSDHLEVNKQIMDNMIATYQWRMEQIKNGKIEVRCERTVAELEEIYGNSLLHVLEMKKGEAAFDDYRTLVNLIE